jgi:hypothetical protein
MTGTTYLHELIAAGEMVAQGPSADIELLDIVEMARTGRDGKIRRSYYRVWEMPCGEGHANNHRRFLFNGWKVSAANPFGFAAMKEINLSRCEADGSFRGRLESGVTNIYRMAR